MDEPSDKAVEAAAKWKISHLPEFMRLRIGPLIVMALREAYAFGYDQGQTEHKNNE